MKRCLMTLAGAISVFASTGCCCDWCNWCSPCGGGCGPSYGTPYAAPPGAFYTPAAAPALGALPAPVVTGALPTTYYPAPVTAAVVPIESLPTY